jgi:HTH-type transcriptional regulator/antitoxin HigA
VQQPYAQSDSQPDRQLGTDGDTLLWNKHAEGVTLLRDAGLFVGQLDHGDVPQVMDLDALSDLVAAYEDEHYAIEPASDAEMFRHLMEAKGVTQAQLSRDTTIPKSTISEILAGKKHLSRQLIRKFADYFRVEASVLAANF